ncbi:MAG: hydrogen peroxide-dependent heme synthase [Planctomycetaceae bacterium]
MNRPPRAPLPDPTIKLTEGWHCLHIYYQLDRLALAGATPEVIAKGKEEFAKAMDAEQAGVERLQLSVTSGHKADFGLMVMDPDPLAVDRVHQSLRSTSLGPFLVPTYSFVSITEISEYVPSVEQYTERLKREGTDPATIEARANAYTQRLPKMNQQRLYPDIPELPVVCFYPMNKIRDPHANWYTKPFSERSAMMAEHATSGISFAGKVSQLITASTGFDDWEWGVTLWGRAPEHIKDIVYTMRFDKASAKYAEFGPFYIGYVADPQQTLEHLGL